MCTWGVALFFKFILKTSILYRQSQSITSYRELSKSEIDNTLLKDEDFHKYLLYHTIFYFILKRNKSSNFHTLCCKKNFFLSFSKTHFENRRSYHYCKQYCSSRAENWWNISTQKPPNVGSSIAISEPIIAGLVLATESPNSMKLGNLVQ